MRARPTSPNTSSNNAVANDDEDEEDDDVDPYDEMNDDSMELFVIVGAHESYVVRAKYQYDIVVDGDAAPLYAYPPRTPRTMCQQSH